VKEQLAWLLPSSFPRTAVAQRSATDDENNSRTVPRRAGLPVTFRWFASENGNLYGQNQYYFEPRYGFLDWIPAFAGMTA
jgi:hypothetical protein